MKKTLWFLTALFALVFLLFVGAYAEGEAPETEPPAPQGDCLGGAEHTPVIREEMVPASCTVLGMRQKVIACSVCGREIDRIVLETYPELGHDWGDMETVSAPTCEAAGLGIRVCRNDPSHTVYVAIPAIGHDWGEWELKTPADCETDGEEVRTCGNDPTHQQTRAIPAIGHDWGEWQVTARATCFGDGVETRVCSRNAAHKETRAIPQVGHIWGAWTVTTPATCEADGVETRECVFVAEHKDIHVLPATGHKAAPYLLDGQLCFACQNCQKLFDVTEAGAAENVEILRSTTYLPFNRGVLQINDGFVGVNEGEIIHNFGHVGLNLGSIAHHYFLCRPLDLFSAPLAEGTALICSGFVLHEGADGEANVYLEAGKTGVIALGAAESAKEGEILFAGGSEGQAVKEEESFDALTGMKELLPAASGSKRTLSSSASTGDIVNGFFALESAEASAFQRWTLTAPALSGEKDYLARQLMLSPDLPEALSSDPAALPVPAEPREFVIDTPPPGGLVQSK